MRIYCGVLKIELDRPIRSVGPQTDHDSDPVQIQKKLVKNV